MQEKSNKGLIWLIVILIILVVSLMGFIVYREFYSEEKPSVDNTTNTTTNNVLDDEGEDDIQQYVAEWTGTSFDLLDKANIDEYSNFKNKKLKIGKIDFTLNCTGYNLAGGNACDEFEILINGKSNNIKSSVEVETHLTVANDIVVISSGGYMGTMKVISDSGSKIFEKEIVLSYRKEYDGFNDGDGTPTLKEGKLYFYTQKDDKTIIKNYLDFQNGFDEIQVEELEGYIGEY